MFSKKEISELNRIVDFFESEICRIEKERNLEKCYKSFFLRMSDNYTKVILDIGIPIDRQLAFHSSLDSGVKNEIWGTVDMLYRRFRWDNNKIATTYPDSLYGVIKLDYRRKYMTFLEKSSFENEKIKFYHSQVLLAHEISPSLTKEVIENFRSYDINNESIKLMLAIHYLTLNYEQSLKKNSENKLDERLKAKH